MYKLQKKSSATKREHPALQKIEFLNFFLFFCVIFVHLDPDCEFEFGSRYPIESWYNLDPDTVPDPQHCFSSSISSFTKWKHWMQIFSGAILLQSSRTWTQPSWASSYWRPASQARPPGQVPGRQAVGVPGRQAVRVQGRQAVWVLGRQAGPAAGEAAYWPGLSPFFSALRQRRRRIQEPRSKKRSRSLSSEDLKYDTSCFFSSCVFFGRTPLLVSPVFFIGVVRNRTHRAHVRTKGATILALLIIPLSHTCRYWIY